MRMFSVAPTLGKSSQIWAPCRPSASATTQPCSISLWAPSWRRPFWCMSSGREPIASPPGSATTARLQRPTSGPSTQTDARSLPIAGESARWLRSAGVVIVTVSPSMVTVQPRLRRTSAIRGTSRICGQLVRVVVPSASSAAAISFRTLFLAPTTSTSPASRAPPCTWKCSVTSDHHARAGLVHARHPGVDTVSYPAATRLSSKRSPVKVLSRVTSPAGFALVLLLFFLLPFVSVSCDVPGYGQAGASYTGSHLVSGTDPEVPAELRELAHDDPEAPD